MDIILAVIGILQFVNIVVSFCALQAAHKAAYGEELL